MKAFGLFFMIFFTAAKLVAQQEDAIIGTWLTEEKDGKIQIFKVNDRYFGKVIDGKDMFEVDGKTSRKDIHNPDPKLRTRNIHNMIILSHFRYEEGEWVEGKVYDSRNGKTYSSQIKLNADNLELRGYIGTPLLGKTTVWTRIK